MSVTVSPGPQQNWLTFVEDGTDQQVDIHVVKNAGQDPVVTVTNANHVSFQHSEPGLAGLDVKAGGSESETSIDTTANAYVVDVLLTADGNGGYSIQSNADYGSSITPISSQTAAY